MESQDKSFSAWIISMAEDQNIERKSGSQTLTHGSRKMDTQVDSESCVGTVTAASGFMDTHQQTNRSSNEGPVNCTDSELSIYLQALAEGYLPTYYSDTSQSVRLKSIPIASKSYRKGKKTVAFPGFQSLQMFVPSTASSGGDESTSSAADSLASTSQQQAKAKGSTAKSLGSGLKCRESLAKYNHDSHSWKTAHCLPGVDWGESSETWPAWGMTLGGDAFRLAPLVRHTCESDCSLWHTPVARDWKGYTTRSGESICNQLRAKFGGCGYPHPEFIESLMLWPIGYSGLRPLATAKFQSWLHSHGESLRTLYEGKNDGVR